MIYDVDLMPIKIGKVWFDFEVFSKFLIIYWIRTDMPYELTEKGKIFIEL